MTTAVDHFAAERILARHLSGRPANTERAYRLAIEAFRSCIGARDLAHAVQLLLTGGHGEAFDLAMRFRDYLMETGAAPSTINNRLAVLRSLVKTARLMGVVAWKLEVQGVASEKYRDTRGPGVEGYRKLLVAAGDQDSDVKAARDTALVRLLFDMALRLSEALGVNMKGLDLEGSRLAVIGKGKTEPRWYRIPAPTRSALWAYVQLRGAEPGPVFVSLTKVGSVRRPLRRLQAGNARRGIKSLGAKAGVTVRPHGLRHSGITQALELTDGDVRAVQRYSRHATADTVLIYDDNREDLGGRLAERVAASASEEAQRADLVRRLSQALDETAAKLGRQATLAAVRKWAT